MKRAAGVLAAIVLAVSSMTSLAVEGPAQVTGTVTQVEKGRVDVKGSDGKTTSVTLSSSTVFTNTSTTTKEKASAADLEPGVRVAIAATKGKAGLEAVEVKIGPAEVVYTCPMHPEVRQDKQGKCPKCGMFLEKKG